MGWGYTDLVARVCDHRDNVQSQLFIFYDDIKRAKVIEELQLVMNADGRGIEGWRSWCA